MNENKFGTNPPATPDANKDPITGTPGAHPVGVGVGAVGGGAAAGAIAGAVAGPIGVVAGAAIGAVVGGLVGKGAAEVINPTVESKFWRDNHPNRPYALSEYSYDEFAPAYRYGWESFDRRNAQNDTYESSEASLERGWDQFKGTSRLGWNQAKHATRDAWNRVHDAAVGPSKPAVR